MKDTFGQLTPRSVVIGCIGCVIITAASLYTALKMGALPWPIVFAALISLFFLRIFGSRSLNEANVTHTIMSAGAMVAGGLAFTIPGIWMLGLGEVSLLEMVLIALAGVLLGLVACGILRRQFVEVQELEFPMGQAAAETLYAGERGGKTGIKLFGAMGFAGVFTALRDLFGAIPSFLFGNVAIPGIVFGVYVSPMMLAVGFLVGTTAMLAWFGGALGQVLIVSGGSALGFYDLASGQSINSCLGMGLMIGFGVAVVAKDIIFNGARSLSRGRNGARSLSRNRPAAPSHTLTTRAGIIALLGAACALGLCMAVGIGPLPSLVVVVFSFVTVVMAAQSVGQTGIDPMEIFGLIALLFIAAFSDTAQVQLFFVAAVIAVACGLGGDVMNDFKAGHLIGTSPKAQMIGQAIGGVLGALVSAGALYALAANFGIDAFGPGKEFVSTQASVVASLISGISCVPAFVLGVVAGFVLHCIGAPAMMIGLGIYLPFYLSFSAFLGCVVKLGVDLINNKRRAALPEEQREQARVQAEQSGLVIASGILGGESIVGVLMALSGLFAL